MLLISPDQSRLLPDAEVAVPLAPRLARLNLSSSNGRIGLTVRRLLYEGRRAPLASIESGRATVQALCPVPGNRTSGNGKSAHYLVARRCSTTLSSGEQQWRPVDRMTAVADQGNEACGLKMLLLHLRMWTPSLQALNLLPYLLLQPSIKRVDQPSRPFSLFIPPRRLYHPTRMNPMNPTPLQYPQSPLSICTRPLQRVAAPRGYVRRLRRSLRRRFLRRSTFTPSVLRGPPMTTTTTTSPHGRPALSPPLPPPHPPPHLSPSHHLAQAPIRNLASTTRAMKTRIDIGPFCLRTRWC